MYSKAESAQTRKLFKAQALGLIHSQIIMTRTQPLQVPLALATIPHAQHVH